MAISTRDGLVAAIAAGPTSQFSKASMVTVAGFFYSNFRVTGCPTAGPAAATSTGATFDRTTQGALPIPAASNTSYLSSFEATAAQAQTLIVADRLLEYGGLSAAVITAQTVSSLSLPTRASSATDVELWLEVFSAGGATSSVSATASYTNQAGTSGRTTQTLTLAASGFPANRTYQFGLQSGDTGVQSVQSVTLNTSSGTAGNIGLVLRRSLLTGAIPVAGVGFHEGWAETDLTICPDAACLEILTLATTTSTGQTMGNIGIAQG